MKILAIHSNFITVEPKTKAIKDAEAIDKAKLEMKECLVVFSAVEKKDEANPDNVTKRLVKEVEDILNQVKAKKVMLYPYVHLTSSPSSPSTALKVLKEAESMLLKNKIEVMRAPFGWYKAFTISCKGHPLSELSREFGPEDVKEEKKDDISDALKAEEKMKSKYYIVDTAGKMHELSVGKSSVSGYDFKGHAKLKTFVDYDLAKSRTVTEEPPHVRLMQKLELVDYEPGSDPGNLRYYPKGRLLKGLIEEWVTRKVVEYGGMEIEAPIMYDFEHPSLKSYLNRFPARQYSIQTPNKKVFLRFAACFGQFLMMHDAQVSYKHLPLKLYEMTRYSFRMEQHGELTGLRRLRAFTMPDCHAFCANMDQAKEEMKKRFELGKQIQDACGISTKDDLELAIRITKEFYDSNKAFVNELINKWGKPALLEMWNERFFYFVMKYEWNFVDASGKASTLNTDQMDVENAERYDISYIDADGQKKRPIIMHLSPSGAIERVMYALLEKAHMEQQLGKVPVFPLWLSPIQVRIIPVTTDKHLDFSKELLEDIEKENIRVDLDDRDESVGKKIRTAGMDWIPYSIVVGDDEMGSGKFNVKDRYTDKQRVMTKEELIEEIKQKVKGMPFRQLSVPKYMSMRPIFRSSN